MAGAIENEVPTFEIIVTKLYVPAVAFPAQDNAKLLQQLKKEQLAGININQNQQCRCDTDI